MANINWEKECDLAIERMYERREQVRILRLQDLVCKTAKSCEDEKALRSILGFCAGMLDMRFVDNGIDDMRIETKKAVAL